MGASRKKNALRKIRIYPAGERKTVEKEKEHQILFDKEKEGTSSRRGEEEKKDPLAEGTFIYERIRSYLLLLLVEEKRAGGRKDVPLNTGGRGERSNLSQ